MVLREVRGSRVKWSWVIDSRTTTITSNPRWERDTTARLAFPLVIPFLLLDDATFAVRVSHLIGLAVRFLAGWVLARLAVANPWQDSVALALTGAMLMTAIIAHG